MNEHVKQFREVFVQKISQSGATRIYFGDVVRIFDEVLADFHAFLDVKPGAPEPKQMTATEIVELNKQLTVPEGATLDFASAEALLSSMKGSRKEEIKDVMPLDDTEPQPNADEIAALAAHAKGVKEGKIQPPAEADIKKVKGLKIPVGSV